MAGSWDIKFPSPPLQPLRPVQPGTAIKDRDGDARKQRRDPERDKNRTPEAPQDDGHTHIDDYA